MKFRILGNFNDSDILGDILVFNTFEGDILGDILGDIQNLQRVCLG